MRLPRIVVEIWRLKGDGVTTLIFWGHVKGKGRGRWKEDSLRKVGRTDRQLCCLTQHVD